ncbi:MAG: heme-binding protein [Alphaproteobacteria bacterium]|jgi:hypothetical protein
MKSKHILAVMGLFAVLFAAGKVAMADTYKSNETPKYTVERNEGDIELRDYAPRIMAEVSVQGSQSQAVSAGFRVLAGYIFGANDGGAKVAMTTPVTQVPGETIAMTTPVTQSAREGNWVVQFMMPGSFTLDTLPKPRDPAIRFVSLPATRQVVLRFSGRARSEALSEKEAQLRSWARGQSLELASGPYYYFYDAPWTLPWNRRNEVAFTLK